jgi:hypothetical protein
MRRVALVAVAVASALGCSILTNLDDLGSDASATSDASDASVDIAVEATTHDAGSDGHFCDPYIDAGLLVYCEDFDSVTDASLLNLDLTGGATATVDTMDWTSPPASLLATAPAADGGVLKAFLAHSMSVAPSQVTLDFELEVEATGNDSANVAVIAVSSGASQWQLVLDLAAAGGFEVQESIPTADGGHDVINHSHITFPFGMRRGTTSSSC